MLVECLRHLQRVFQSKGRLLPVDHSPDRVFGYWGLVIHASQLAFFLLIVLSIFATFCPHIWGHLNILYFIFYYLVKPILRINLVGY